MNNRFERLFAWLESRYQAVGIELVPEGGKAVWTQIDGARADLGDFELGLLTRFAILTDSPTVSEVFQKEIRWALEAASQFDYRTSVEAEQSDSLGAWQVQIVWIVTKTCKEAWLQCMRELRARSAHAEEIGLELVDLSCQEIDEALAEDGIPSLMFKTRELMRKSGDEMPSWISPDAEVEAKLRALPASIIDKDQREFSTEFLEKVLSGGSKQASEPPLTSPTCGQVKIHNVRNIANAELTISTHDYASVIHGPNGTGKSSLFEAVSIALLGTSKRHCEFLEDKDVLPSARVNYSGQVLKRFGSAENDGPTITVGQREVLASLDSNPETVKARLIAGRGTVLAQESAREFVAMNASELASYVLGDYSALARRVQGHVDDGVQAARGDWQNWLRSYGLNASISKADTILRRLVDKVLQSNCPPEPQGALTWLKNIGEALPEFSERAQSVKNRWDELDSPLARETVVEQASVAVERTGSAQRPIASWLGERAGISSSIVGLIEDAASVINEIRDEWVSIKSDLTEWGDWVASPTRLSMPPANEDGAFGRADEIRVRLAELAPIGQRLRARKDHLSGISASFLASWQEAMPHKCPTCDADHNRTIADVISDVLLSTTAEYEQLRSEYSSLQQEEKRLRARSDSVTKPCPISIERQRQIAALLRLQFEGPDSLDALVQIPQSKAALFSRFERIFVVPAWKSPDSVEAIAAASNEIAASILELRAEGAFKQELPIRWGHLKRSVDTIALEVVGNHLPRTIGGLWREISLILAPAYWIQACAPEMTMELRRGAEKLGVTVRRDDATSEIPARHILNQAEQHVLGLAWFFTRFLTHGRFLIPFIALDDPAQEMDQVTFRKFARFVQAFQRAHRFISSEFGILVLLHQEERAIEFARLVTRNAALTVLEWSATVQDSGPNSTVRSVQLRNPQQRARHYVPKLGSTKPITVG